MPPCRGVGLLQVLHQDLTDKWDMRALHPTIELDGGGQIKRIYFNERTRDSWRQWAAHGASSMVQAQGL